MKWGKINKHIDFLLCQQNENSKKNKINKYNCIVIYHFDLSKKNDISCIGDSAVMHERYQHTAALAARQITILMVEYCGKYLSFLLLI